MKVLVTGSSGLIGSEAVEYYHERGHDVHGVDNNMRAEFFGPKGDTTWNRRRLEESCKGFRHHEIDIRDRVGLEKLFTEVKFDMVIHCAAQPSHDKARDIPLLDFEVNALGTVNLLEATRLHSPEAVFIYMGTNKTYGDAPNEVPMIELETRWEYADETQRNGIDETLRIDRCLHSLMGASKTAADVMAQEYGKYYGLKTAIFRGGCLTGPSHSGVELHGFLNYLVKVAVHGGTYRVFGYKGKQVRDNIHSHDVIEAFEAFRRNPRPGEVYNLGGGPANSVSILEAFAKLEALTGKPVQNEYVDEARVGDHMCYYSDLRKFKNHYPEWSITRSLDSIFEEMVLAEQSRKP